MEEQRRKWHQAARVRPDRARASRSTVGQAADLGLHRPHAGAWTGTGGSSISGREGSRYSSALSLLSSWEGHACAEIRSEAQPR